MNAVTYERGRAATVAAGRPPSEIIRKAIFARFMDALKQSRDREARRVIARYAHLAQLETNENQ